MAVYGWVIRYSSVVEVIYFGLFFLLMVWCSHEMCIAAYCSEVASISPAPGG